jgi:hypothetical protein
VKTSLASRGMAIVVLSGCPLLFVSACAHKGSVGFPIEQLEREIRYCGEYRDYMKLEGSKALAVAGEPCGIFVSGLAYGEADALTAETRAVQLCEARRADRRVGAPCVLHARGNCATAQSALRYCRDLADVRGECPDQPDPGKEECPAEDRAVSSQRSGDIRSADSETQH